MGNQTSHSIKTGDPETLCPHTRKKPRRGGKTKVCKGFVIVRSGSYVKEGMVREERFDCYSKSLTNPDKKNAAGAPAPVGQRSRICTTTDSSQLKKILGYPVQGHHILSTSQFADMARNNPTNTAQKIISFRNIMRGAGYDVNNGNNVFFLPTKHGHTKWDSIQKHVGSHVEDYYDKVYAGLERVYKKYKSKPCASMPWAKVHKDMHKLEDDIYKLLKTRKLWLYDTSQQLFNADSNRGYRGEIGNGKKSAMKWLSKMKRKKNSWYVNRRPFPYRTPSNAL